MKLERKCRGAACRDLCVYIWAFWNKDGYAMMLERAGRSSQIHQDSHTCRPDAGSSSVRSTGIRDRFFSYLWGNYKGFLLLLAAHISSRALRVSRASEQLKHRRQPHWANSPLFYIPHESYYSLPEMLLWKLHSIFWDETSVIYVTFPALWGIMQ